MRRREFIALMGGAAAAWPLGTRAQQTMPVVGFLCLSSPEAFRPRLMAFRKGLVATGFVEDRNVDIEYRWANDDARRLPQLAAELIQQNVKVIATAGGPAPALAAKALTSSIPIVFATPGSDPIETGLVTSLNRPGANVTGVGYSLSGVSGKQIEFLHEVVPPAETVGVLVNPTNPATTFYLQALHGVASSLGRKVLIVNASEEAELKTGLSGLLERRIRALVVTRDVFFFRELERLVSWAARSRVVAIYGSREFPQWGGLMSYGTDIDEAYRQEGVYVGRILKGERPADLPVQQAVKFELVMNLKTAKAHDISLPLSLLGRADEVIE
jgi:putative ABC transport system substrate-binding protein